MANPALPDSVPCPSGPTTYDQSATGAGNGLTKDAALSAARSDADTQLDMDIQCGEPRSGSACGDPIITIVEPVYDCSRPNYTPHKRGWKCSVQRCRTVSVQCKQ
jgi:hypothetical protein